MNKTYTVPNALAVYDAGQNRPNGTHRFIYMSDIDPDRDGKIEWEDIEAFKKFLSTTAISQGASPVVPHSKCVIAHDIDTRNQISDDSVLSFNAGTVISTAYTEMPDELINDMVKQGFLVLKQ